MQRSRKRKLARLNGKTEVKAKTIRVYPYLSKEERIERNLPSLQDALFFDFGAFRRLQREK